MLCLVLTLIGLAVGFVAGWLLRPKLEVRAQQLLPALKSVEAAIGADGLAARIDVEISEIESQMRQGFDRERNAARLQILRDVKGGI